MGGATLDLILSIGLESGLVFWGLDAGLVWVAVEISGSKYNSRS